jgi:hypothetical protein
VSQQALFEAPEPPKPVAKNIEPYQQYAHVTVYHGDCIEVMARMPANSVDALVSDPPYGIGFMGLEWDTFAPDAPHIVEASTRVNRMIESDNPNLRGRSAQPGPESERKSTTAAISTVSAVFSGSRAEWAAEAFRVLKPGAHGVICGAPRSSHRLFCGFEDAGIRDSGLPRVAVRAGVSEVTQPRRRVGRVGHCAEAWPRTDRARPKAV